MPSVVYRIECIDTLESYIGASVNVAERWDSHRMALRRDAHSSRKLQRRWNEYGPEAFQLSLVEECEPDQLWKREKFHIMRETPAFNNEKFNPVTGKIIKPNPRGPWTKTPYTGQRQGIECVRRKRAK